MESEELRLLLIIGVILVVAIFGGLFGAYVVFLLLQDFGLWFFVGLGIVVAVVIVLALLGILTRKKKTIKRNPEQQKTI